VVRQWISLVELLRCSLRFYRLSKLLVSLISVFLRSYGHPRTWGGGDLLARKITQCPNARVLKSGCKRTQIAWKIKTITKIVLLKACILNDLYPSINSLNRVKSKTCSKKKRFFSWRSFSDRLISRRDICVWRRTVWTCYRSNHIFERNVSAYSRRSKNNMRHC